MQAPADKGRMTGRGERMMVIIRVDDCGWINLSYLFLLFATVFRRRRTLNVK